MDLQLAAMREARKMTQGELAEKIGSTLRKVSSWETGETKIRLEDAAIIADLFEVTLDELAGREWPRQSMSHTSDESRLLNLYRDTDDRGRAAIMRTARGEQGVQGQAPPAVNE